MRFASLKPTSLTRRQNLLAVSLLAMLCATNARGQNTGSLKFIAVDIAPLQLQGSQEGRLIAKMRQVRRSFANADDDAINLKIESTTSQFGLEEKESDNDALRLFERYVLGEVLLYPGEVRQLAIAVGKAADRRLLVALFSVSGLRSANISDAPSLTAADVAQALRQGRLERLVIARCPNVDQLELKRLVADLDVRVEVYGTSSPKE